MEYKPQVIMSQAANTPEGILITFATERALKNFRFRCYAARNREEGKLAKAAVAEGVPPEDTGWEALVFLPKGLNKLWVGVPDADTFGICKIESGKG